MYQVKWRGLFSGKLSALWSIIIVSCLLLWQFHWMSAVSPQSVCLYIPDDTPLFASIRETPWTFSPTHTQLQCVCVCVCVLANMPWVCLLLLRFNLCHPAAVETAPVDALYCFPPVFFLFPLKTFLSLSVWWSKTYFLCSWLHFIALQPVRLTASNSRLLWPRNFQLHNTTPDPHFFLASIASRALWIF